MHAERAELSSLATTLDELATRVEQIADRLSTDGRGGHAADLYDVDRALRSARRRLAVALERMR